MRGYQFPDTEFLLVAPQKPYSADYYIKSFRDGEAIGFDYFFKLYYKRLCYFASHYIEDAGAVEDLVSDVFIRVWIKRQRFFEEAHLRNYLYISVRNGCLRRLQDRQRQERYNQHAAANKETIEQSTIENIIRAEFIHQVYQSLECLPPACRVIFKKLYVEGKSIKETAGELQLAQSTVQSQKQRGIEILRKRLFDPGN